MVSETAKDLLSIHEHFTQYPRRLAAIFIKNSLRNRRLDAISDQLPHRRELAG